MGRLYPYGCGWYSGSGRLAFLKAGQTLNAFAQLMELWPAWPKSAASSLPFWRLAPQTKPQTPDAVYNPKHP